MPNRGGIQGSFSPIFYSCVEVQGILFYFVLNMKRIKESITYLLVVFVLCSVSNWRANLCAQGFVPPPMNNPFAVESFKRHIKQHSGLSSTGILQKRGVGGYFQKLVFDRIKSGRFEPVDSVRLLVVRVDFPDRGFNPVHDPAYIKNELRHLYEYYIGASKGIFKLDWQLSDSIVHLPENEGYYGEDGHWEERMLELLQCVVDSLDATTDFSKYDAFAVIHAGAGQETDFNGDSQWQIWSGFLDPEEIKELLADSLGVPGVETNDSVGGEPFYINNLIVVPETASQDGMTFGALGIYAYELGYRLGMFPLFDTTPSPYPDSQGIGAFGLMAYGLYNANGFVPAFPCAFHRYLMGWVDVYDITTDCEVRLRDINSSPVDTVLIRIPISSTEYFLIANRVQDTNFNGRFDFIEIEPNGIPDNEDTLLGAEFDFFLTKPTNPPGTTGSGILIWHIDEEVIAQSIAGGFYPEDNRDRKGVDLEEADGVQDLDRPGGMYAFGCYLDSFRQGNNDHFGPNTIPSSSNNNGSWTGIDVSDISDAGPVMSMHISFKLEVDIDRAEVQGRVRDFSMIPFSLSHDTPDSLYIITDSGKIYKLEDVSGNDWVNTIKVLFDPIEPIKPLFSPVFARFDNTGYYELILADSASNIFAIRSDGQGYTIDSDITGSVCETDFTTLSAPVVIEVDGDDNDEVILLGERADSIFAVLMNSSVLLGTDSYEQLGTITDVYLLGRGSIHSNPAQMIVSGLSGVKEGICYISSNGDKDYFNFLTLREGGLPASEIGLDSYNITVALNEDEELLNISCGDIDGDGSDEAVFSSGSNSLVYVVPGNDGETWRVAGVNLFSKGAYPCALADIDGDAILETLVQDDKYAYVFTGFGTLVSGWPVQLPSSPVARSGYREVKPSPIAFDIDGDDLVEPVFCVNGDVVAFDMHGDVLNGMPIPGESGVGTFLTVCRATEGIVLFQAGAVPQIRGGENVSYIRRVGFESAGVVNDTWPVYRHDPEGTSRQITPQVQPVKKGKYVDENSLICYPNPVMNGELVVRVPIYSSAVVKISILNVEGEKLFSISGRHEWPEGSNVPYEVKIQLGDISSGVYICLIEISGNNWSWKGYRKFAVIR